MTTPNALVGAKECMIENYSWWISWYYCISKESILVAYPTEPFMCTSFGILQYWLCVADICVSLSVCWSQIPVTLAQHTTLQNTSTKCLPCCPSLGVLICKVLFESCWGALMDLYYVLNMSGRSTGNCKWTIGCEGIKKLPMEVFSGNDDHYCVRHVDPSATRGHLNCV